MPSPFQEVSVGEAVKEATAADHADHRGRILVIPALAVPLGSTPRGVAGMVSLGSPASIAKGGAMAETRKLYRSKTDRVLAGVCGGLAQYFNLEATLIRVLFVLLAVLGGSGLVLYVAMWIIVPNQP
jgi:phage shock protein C